MALKKLRYCVIERSFNADQSLSLKILGVKASSRAKLNSITPDEQEMLDEAVATVSAVTRTPATWNHQHTCVRFARPGRSIGTAYLDMVRGRLLLTQAQQKVPVPMTLVLKP